MTDIQFILDAITNLDGEGNIAINKYSSTLLNTIKDKTCFLNSYRYDSLNTINFEDTRFLAPNGVKPINYSKLPIEFQFELKVITLCLFFYGKKLNTKKLKWSSTVAIISPLKNLANILIDRGCNSFRSLNSLSKLEVQKIGKEYCTKCKKAKNLIELDFATLCDYKLITTQTYEALILNLNTNISIPNNYNSFPIIPDHTLLEVFKQINLYKETFIEKFKQWSKYNLEDIERIEKGRYRIENGEYLSSRLHEIKGVSFIDFLNKFRKVVFYNTILFTGMRKDEVKEIKNDSTITQDDDYHISSKLSKTVDGQQELTWVSSKSCNELLQILADLNEQMKKRVQAIINIDDPRFDPKYIAYLEANLKEDKLFSFNYSLNFCRFDSVSYLKTSDLNKNYSVFKINLDQHDINQLSFLDCNYKTLSSNSPDHLKPYKVGDYFNITPHQFRHTFAFFMISNNLCSIQEIKHQFKHLQGSMSYIYSKRAIYSELINTSKSLDETIKIKSLMGFSQSISQNKSTGGGVKFILNALNLKDFKFNIAIDPIEFKGIDQINSYLKINKDSINFLPHGFCMNGTDCSLKSVAEPLSCINCHGYVSTELNLPYWKGLLEDLKIKLDKLYKLPAEKLPPYENLILNLENKTKKITEIIDSLHSNKIEVQEL